MAAGEGLGDFTKKAQTSFPALSEKKSRAKSMNAQTKLLVFIPFLGCWGCSHFSSEIQNPDGTKLKTTAYTFMDSKSELAKSSALAGPRTNRAAITVSGLSQESQSPTGLVSIIINGIPAAAGTVAAAALKAP